MCARTIKKTLVHQIMKTFLIFFQKIFCFVLHTELRTVFLELVFCRRCEEESSFFSPHVDTQLSQHILLQRLSVLQGSAVATHKSSDCACVGMFLD